jgi:DNA polymerase sigma
MASLKQLGVLLGQLLEHRCACESVVTTLSLCRKSCMQSC